MKGSGIYVLSSCVLAILSACAPKSQPGSGQQPSPGTEKTAESAKGKVNGQNWTFQSGLFHKVKLDSGKDALEIKLAAKPLAGCRERGSNENPVVLLIVPIAKGRHQNPATRAIFTNGEVQRNSVAKEVTVTIDAVTDTEVRGKVDATDGKSSIIGSFSAKSCDVIATPVPEPEPQPLIDVRKVFENWGEEWSGERNISTPGTYGSLSLWIHPTQDQSDVNIVRFQMGGMCSYSDKNGKAIGLHWTSEQGADTLSADGSGRIFLNCSENEKFEIGSMTVSEMQIRSVDCRNLATSLGASQADTLTLKMTDPDTVEAARTFRTEDGKSIDCRGQIHRNN